MCMWIDLINKWFEKLVVELGGLNVLQIGCPLPWNEEGF